MTLKEQTEADNQTFRQLLSTWQVRCCHYITFKLVSCSILDCKEIDRPSNSQAIGPASRPCRLHEIQAASYL